MTSSRAKVGLRGVFTALALIIGVIVAVVGFWLHGSQPTVASSPTSQPATLTLSDESGMSESVRAIHIDPTPEPNLQHSLSLLRASNATRPPVRILFYGQSITEQGWWLQVADYLRHQYPNALLDIENRAIGAHPSDRLVKTAEADLYPFQPDLVIFQVYGSHKKYAEIIKNLAQQTTADILMANDHVTKDGEISEDTEPKRLWLRTWIYRTKLFGTQPERDANWEAWMDYDFLPTLAAHYHAQFANVRDPWKRYLIAHGLKPSELLRDSIHLNQRGQDLMAAIIDSYLRPASFVPGTQDDDRFVEEPLPVVGGDSATTLKVPFHGTRVELSTIPGQALDASFLVDGKPPCQIPAAYQFSRASAYPGSNWPAILRVQRGATALVEELWTVTIENFNADLSDFSFKISGSVTGADGIGSSRTKFVSRSGRVIIDSDDWNLSYGKSVIKTDISDHFQITFSAYCTGSDSLHVSADSAASTFRIVQGLSNGPHVIEMPTSAAHSIKALRFYRPLYGRS